MSTYTPIASQTLSAAAPSVTFSSIPQGYTDLVVVANTKAGATDNPIYMRFNSDSANNYSATRLNGNGSSAGSSRTSNNSAMFPSWAVAPGTAEFSHNMTAHIQNYSNSTTYKTALSRANNTDSGQGTEATVGLWRSTAAITTIELSLSATTFASGSTFTLYGIQVGDKAQKAQGGNVVVSSGGYIYHAFTASGTFIPSEEISADVLVIGGGGGGGAFHGGGGGGGAIEGSGFFQTQNLTARSYLISIGAGGTGGTNGGLGNNGNNSLFYGTSTITALGGGGGGSAYVVPSAGGSGGGTGQAGHAAGTASGSNTNAGGTSGGSNQVGGGGGGATAAGTNGSGSSGGAGGQGKTLTTIDSNFTALGFASIVVSSGGGGGASSGGGAASGGTGAGAGTNNDTAGGNATSFGSGGGGGGYNTGAGGNGGNGYSGLVIIRYAV